MTDDFSVEKPDIERNLRALLFEREAEIERLTVENAELRRWKALDKPLTAAMSIANSYNGPLRAEVEQLQGFQDAAADLEDRLEAALAENERLTKALDLEQRRLKVSEEALRRALAAGKP